MEARTSCRKSRRVSEKAEAVHVEIVDWDDPTMVPKQQQVIPEIENEAGEFKHNTTKNVDVKAEPVSDDSLEYVIDCVRETRKRKVKGEVMTEYLIKWLGYDEKYNEWLPESALPEEIKDRSVYPIEKYDPAFNKGTWINFYLYLFERRLIYLRSVKDPRAEKWKDYKLDPWIEILQLMNTYDELDSGTEWFHHQIAAEKQVLNSATATKEEKIGMLKKFLFKSICYCTMNRRETFDAFTKPLSSGKNEKNAPLTGIPEPKEFKAFCAHIKDRRAEGLKCFTGGHQNVGFERWQKMLQYVLDNLNKIAKGVWDRHPNFEKVCTEVILRINQIGYFFAQQICNDLSEIGVLERSTTYASMGTGARNGVKLIWPQTGDSQAATLARCVQLYNEQEAAFKELGIEFPWHNNEKIHLHNFEHALCQWQRYFAVACHQKVDATTKRFMRATVKQELDARGRKITKNEIKEENEQAAEKKKKPSATRSSDRRKKSKGH